MNQVINAVITPVVLTNIANFRDAKYLKRKASLRRRCPLPGRLRSSRGKGRWWPRKVLETTKRGVYKGCKGEDLRRDLVKVKVTLMQFSPEVSE